jgi:membrane protease subunit (stomatin/prohibitin family)
MGLVRMAARTAVISGTATAVSGRVAHRQAQQYSASAVQAQPAAQVAPAAAEDSAATKLQELANLHAQGILSDDEFAAAKAKVLGI